MIKKFKEIIWHWELIKVLVSANLKVKYMESMLGYLWSLLEPLFTMLVYFFVFSVVIKFKVENYLIFLLSGILPWTFLQGSILFGVKTITNNSNLIKKVRLPREIFPLTTVLSKLIEFALSIFVLFFFIFFSKVKFTAKLSLLPFIIIIQFFFVYGLSLILSCSNVFFRDIERIINPAIRLWFYLTPIVYPFSMVPEKLLFIYMLNPMTIIVTLYRYAVLDIALPQKELILSGIFLSFAVFFLGFWFFNRTEKNFLKKI